MIRKFQTSDMDQVIGIWLEASEKAHDFVEAGFWESKVKDMREIHIPSGENYVYEGEEGRIEGFVALSEDTMAALFVSPDCQGEGIGRRLMGKAKEVRGSLSLTVYKENPRSIAFYEKCGFKRVLERVDENTGHPELLMIYPG